MIFVIHFFVAFILVLVRFRLTCDVLTTRSIGLVWSDRVNVYNCTFDPSVTDTYYNIQNIALLETSSFLS